MLKILNRIGLASSFLVASLSFAMPSKAVPIKVNRNSNSYLLAQSIGQTDYNWLDKDNNSLYSTDNNESNDSMSQVNDVDRLRDVSPIDWAYEALNNLASRYGCITGFPNSTYRGNQAVSRYEFAAGLNSCLNKLEGVISASDEVSAQDIETILRLMQDFKTELAIIRGKTDGLQARTRELELTQFSTTTKLSGEVIFGLNSVFTGDTGFQGDLSFTQSEDNDLQLEVLYYSFPVTNNTEVIIGATGTAADDIADTVSILDGDGGSGAISLFGTRNPIYLPPADAGLGIIYNLGDTVEISGGYLASPANEPSDGGGIFDAPYSAIAQVLFTPVDSLDVAITYVHSRNQSDTETGSNKANIQSFTASNAFPDGVSTVSDSYGIELSWAISDRIVVGGWGTLSKVTTLSTLGGRFDRGTQDIWNTALTVALPDLGTEGSMAGIIVGIEPTVTRSSISNIPEDEDLSLHVEAFYQYKINDYLAVTPGVIWITAPDNNTNNEDLVIGTIRTTFSF